MRRPSYPLVVLWSVALIFLVSGVLGSGASGASAAIPSGAEIDATVPSPTAVAVEESIQAPEGQLGGIGRSLDTSLRDRARSLLGLLLLGGWRGASRPIAAGSIGASWPGGSASNWRSPSSS